MFASVAEALPGHRRMSGTAGQLLEHDLRLEARERRAQAEVDAVAEGEVVVGVLALEGRRARRRRTRSRRGWRSRAAAAGSRPPAGRRRRTRSPAPSSCASRRTPASRRSISSTAVGISFGSRHSSVQRSGCASSNLQPLAQQRRGRLVPGEQLGVDQPRDLLLRDRLVALEIDLGERAGEVVARLLEVGLDEADAVAPSRPPCSRRGRPARSSGWSPKLSRRGWRPTP